MLKKRWGIALLAVSICLASVLVASAERLHSANANGVIDPTCTSSSPCIEYDNNSTGQGVKGFSHQGNGLTGWTGWNSTSSTNAKYGVVGNDQSITGSFDGGVLGKSVRGTGIVGTSTNGPGVAGTSTVNDGVDGYTTNPSLTNSARSGVYGNDNSSDGGHHNNGVAGFSTNGVGILGNSSNWVGVEAVGGAFIPSGGSMPALSVTSIGTMPGGESVITTDAIDACHQGTGVFSTTPCNPTSALFRVDGFGATWSTGLSVKGDAYVYFLESSTDISANGDFNTFGGEYLQNGSCVAGCSSSATSMRRVRTYAPRSSQPMIEDDGEAQLISGAGYVRLDPAFANVIDQRADYLVTITPEGDSNGLYVTEKTLRGFVVRENHAGRSSLAFTYRIVTKPFGSIGARLPMVDIPIRAGGPRKIGPTRALR